MFFHKNGRAVLLIVYDSLPGSVSKHEFQAETKKLLDIVARSLYSEKEVGHVSIAPQASQASGKAAPILS